MQVEPNQSTYPSCKSKIRGKNGKQVKHGKAKWLGPSFKNTDYCGKPILTFFLHIVWEFSNVSKKLPQKNKRTTIICSTLASIPNGKFYKQFGELIVGFKAYKPTRSNNGNAARFSLENLSPKNNSQCKWERAKFLPSLN